MQKFLSILLIAALLVSPVLAQKTGAGGAFGGSGSGNTGAKSTAGLGTMARKYKGVLVHVGDSNTNGRAYWRQAYESDWLVSGGLFEGWTSYNIGQNGSTLQEWATSEVTRLDDPTYSGLQPADYQPEQLPGNGRLARVINANPDIIVVRLGTNDLNNPGARASYGTEANLRINLALLVNALLARTHAGILLMMPQPFYHIDYLGITQWVNAAEAREASRRLRVVYREWIGKSDRVEVYDSHLNLFGDYCDDNTVDAQDPVLGAGNILIDDSLHHSLLAARRMAQQVDNQIRGSVNRQLKINTVPDSVLRYDMWATTLYTHQTASNGATSSSMIFQAGPEAVIGQQRQYLLRDKNNITGPVERLKPLVELGAVMPLTGLRELLNIYGVSGFYAYSWASGVTTTLTGVSLTGWQDNNGTNAPLLTISSPDLTGFGGGKVTFYVTDATNLPYPGFFKSPNGTCYRLSVSNAGAISASSFSCP